MHQAPSTRHVPRIFFAFLKSFIHRPVRIGEAQRTRSQLVQWTRPVQRTSQTFESMRRFFSSPVKEHGMLIRQQKTRRLPNHPARPSIVSGVYHMGSSSDSDGTQHCLCSQGCDIGWRRLVKGLAGRAGQGSGRSGAKTGPAAGAGGCHSGQSAGFHSVYSAQAGGLCQGKHTACSIMHTKDHHWTVNVIEALLQLPPDVFGTGQ